MSATPRTDAVEKSVYPVYLNARIEHEELEAALSAWSAHEKNARELETELEECKAERDQFRTALEQLALGRNHEP